MLARCLAVFATTHLLSVGSLTAFLLLLQHALRNSSTAPTISTHGSLSFVHVVNVFSGSSQTNTRGVASEFDLVHASWTEALAAAAAAGLRASIVAAIMPGDESSVPACATRRVVLRRSFMGEGRLPLLQEVLDAADAADGEWVVYTNADIGLQRDFYPRLAALLRSLALLS